MCRPQPLGAIRAVTSELQSETSSLSPSVLLTFFSSLHAPPFLHLGNTPVAREARVYKISSSPPLCNYTGRDYNFGAAPVTSLGMDEKRGVANEDGAPVFIRASDMACLEFPFELIWFLHSCHASALQSRPEEVRRSHLGSSCKTYSKFHLVRRRMKRLANPFGSPTERTRESLFLHPQSHLP